MTLAAWLTIVGICLLGAMSPGPSLAVVLRHTLAGGRWQGIHAALAHGFSVGIYALLCISGLAWVITTSDTLFIGLQISGAAYLAWLGFKGLTSKPNTDSNEATETQKSALRDGALIVFLNPKIAVFFIALFAQVVGNHTSYFEKVLYALTAGVIDGLWYVIVAWLFSNPRWLTQLQSNAVWLERVFGAVLIGLAGKLVVGFVG